MLHFRYAVYPGLSIAVTLRDHADDEARGAQKSVKELDEHRSHELTKLPRDPHRIPEDGHHADEHQRGDARDTVD